MPESLRLGEATPSPDELPGLGVISLNMMEMYVKYTLLIQPTGKHLQSNDLLEWQAASLS